MINENDIYAAIKRLNRSHFDNKEALERHQRQKLQLYFQQHINNSEYFKSWTNKNVHLIPTMDGHDIAKHFSALCSVPRLSHQRLVADGMRAYARAGDWDADAQYYTLAQYVRHQGWQFQVYDRKEQIQKIAHFLSAITRNIGSMSVSIAHFFYFSHIMHRLPKLAQPDYRLYDLFRSYETLVAQLQEQQPDIIIAPHGTLLKLAHDKLAGKIDIHPVQVYCENATLSTRDNLILHKAFGETHLIYSHGGRLLAITCEKGNLHLAENLYFFELHWINKERFIPIYTDFNAQTVPIFRYKSNSIFSTSSTSCACSSPHLSIEAREMLVDDVLWFPSTTGGYVPVFATPLDDFAASCSAWDKEYRIVQESLNQLVIYSESDIKPFINREQELLNILSAHHVATKNLSIHYKNMETPNFFTDNLTRIQRLPFTLPIQCNFLGAVLDN